MITSDSLLQESLFFLMPFFLMLIHYFIKRQDKQFDELVLAAHGINNPKIFASVGLFVATVLLMLFFAPQQVVNNIYGWITVGSVLPLSFIIIYLLQPLLKSMKNTAGVIKFLLKGNFWLVVLSIAAVELLVLYWLKEVHVYVQTQFVFFLVGYSILIVTTNILLSLPASWQILQAEWRTYVVVVIDPIIIVWFALVLVKILLHVFSQLL
jgi:hypothetical protein